MRINLMIEGQEDVTWDQWVALAQACESAGLEGLFRSDHYQSVEGRPERSSLDAWATVAALGAVTEHIRLGTMVSPTSFRHPSVLAKSVVTADHVSGGRVELGIGAGWSKVEHDSYGFPFHDLGTRFDIFEEQLEIIARQFAGESFDFDGDHYTLDECRPLPVPHQAHLPIIVGGNAGPRSVRNAVAWADEYNSVYVAADTIRDQHARILRACEEAGRAPLVHSLMAPCVIGRDQGDLRERSRHLQTWLGDDGDVDAWLAGRGDAWIVGTPDQVHDQLDDLADAGIERVMLQNLLHEDLEAVALIGELAN